MSKHSLNKAVAEIEARQFKYDFQIGEAFRELAESGNFIDEEVELLKAEFILFRFMTKNDYVENIEPRFRPVMKFTNGTVFPDYSELTEDRLKYYLERAGQTTNPIMKARYLDANYEYSKSIGKEEILPKLVDAYVEAAEAEGRGNEMNAIDCLVRAFLVAREHKKDHKVVFDQAREAINRSLAAFKTSNLRWCIDLIELMVHFKNDFKKSELTNAHLIAIEGVEHYRKEDGSFFIRESYLSLEHALKKLLHPDDYSPQDAARENAQLYLAEANNRPDSLFVQQSNLLKAAKILSDAGLKAEASKLTVEAEELGSLPDFAAGFKKISVEETIPKDEIAKLCDELAGHREKAALIAGSRNFLPSWKEAKKTSKDEKYGSIADLFSEVVLNKDNMPIAKGSDDPKTRSAIRYYDVSVGITGMLLHIAVTKALEQSKLTIEDILPQLEKIKLFNEETYATVLRGFEHFFAGRHYEALTILVPQIEDLLGDLFKQRGMKRYRQLDIELVEPRMLGSLLNDVQRFYGKDLARFMEYQLIDAGKENLRNITGHGGLKITTPNLDKKAITILQIYMAILVPVKPILVPKEG